MISPNKRKEIKTYYKKLLTVSTVLSWKLINMITLENYKHIDKNSEKLLVTKRMEIKEGKWGLTDFSIRSFIMVKCMPPKNKLV